MMFVASTTLVMPCRGPGDLGMFWGAHHANNLCVCVCVIHYSVEIISLTLCARMRGGLQYSLLSVSVCVCVTLQSSTMANPQQLIQCTIVVCDILSGLNVSDFSLTASQLQTTSYQHGVTF